VGTQAHVTFDYNITEYGRPVASGTYFYRLTA
jgi:hypothetical protein